MNDTLLPVRHARTRCSLLAAAAALVCVAAAPTGFRDQPDGCPNQGVKEVESVIKYGPWQTCGSGLTVVTKGVTLHDPKSLCPTFAIYEPLHHIPTPKMGFYTTPGEISPITLFTFTCATRWLFGFLPIPVGSSCDLSGTKTVGTVQNYLEVRCKPRGVRDGDPSGRGSLPGGE